MLTAHSPSADQKKIVEATTRILVDLEYVKNELKKR